MSDEVDTRVSPSIHPDVIAGLEDYDDDTRPLLGGAETLLSQAHSALQSIGDAKAGAAINPTLNPFEQLVAVDTHAAKVVNPVLARWDKVAGDLEANIAQHEKEMNASIIGAATNPLASEIRTYLRSMKPAERHAAVTAAINSGDERTIQAICSVPPYLSGIDADERQRIMTDWHAKADPVGAKKVRAMRNALEVLNRNGGIFKRQWVAAVGTHDEYTEDRQGRRILTKRWTPAMVREQVKIAQKPFAVPV